MLDELDEIDDIDELRDRLREAIDDVDHTESRAVTAEQKLDAVGVEFDTLGPATTELVSALGTKTLRQPDVFDAVARHLAMLARMARAFGGKRADDAILEAEARADLEEAIKHVEHGTHPLVVTVLRHDRPRD